MQIAVKISIAKLSNEGKNFRWPPIKSCPCCKGKLWAHGFVKFNPTDFKTPLLLKRLKCTKCKKVLTLKPKEYWKGFRTSVNTIYKRLMTKLTHRPPKYAIGRQNVNFWFSRLMVFLKMEFSAVLEKSRLEDWLHFFYVKEIPFATELYP